MVVLALAFACHAPSADSDTDPVDSGPGYVPLDFDADTATPDHVETVIGASGGATWSVDFDADAEAAGYVDCSYHRSWVHGAELRNAPWLCPDCTAMVQLDAAIDDGQDCYAAITNNGAAAPVEILGWSDTALWRTSEPNRYLTEQGTASLDGSALSWVSDTAFTFTDANGADHNAAFHIVGAATLGETQADPLRGMWPPETYECGWPKTDAPVWEGPYSFAIGDLLPDGVFRDVCNDPVRLDDFLGSWLVIDVSAMDCGPCQAFADGTTAAIAELATEGFDVRTITLLAPSLADPYADASRQNLYDWALAFRLADPVLADRGYGAAVIGRSAQDITGEHFGYPTWIVVGPDGTVRAANVGFGTWDAIAGVIRGTR